MGQFAEIFLGILTAMGGFVEIGELTFTLNAGVRFDYQLLWVTLLGTVGIMVYCEMAGRIAAVKHRPVFSLIRERAGVNAALLTLVAAALVNLLTCAAEIGGVALLWQLLSGAPYRAPMLSHLIRYFGWQMRPVSPRLSVAATRPSGAMSFAGGPAAAGAPASPAADSSPTANVLATCGVSCERAGPPSLTSPWGSSASAKISTLSAPFKNLSTAATCSESPARPRSHCSNASMPTESPGGPVISECSDGQREAARDGSPGRGIPPRRRTSDAHRGVSPQLRKGGVRCSKC